MFETVTKFSPMITATTSNNCSSRTRRSRFSAKFALSKPGTTIRSNLSLALLSLAIVALICGHSMELFHVKFVENNDCRLIATSNFNFALTSPKLAARNWRAISVNGDQVVALTLEPVSRVTMTRAELGPERVALVEALRDEIANSGQSGFTHVSSASGGTSGGNGGSNFMMSSNQMSGSSTSFSSSTSGSTTNSGLMGGNGGEMSFSAKDEDNFSVSKSNLPFDWSRVFFNKDLVTIVSRNGDVRMLSLPVLAADEAEAVRQLKREVREMRDKQAQQLSNTMQHSVDMVSNVFNSIMGQFPKPPDYRNSVGSMFGDNFPFGPNNSPFSSSAGWPFGGGGGGGGVGAFAFAGRR